MENSNINNTQKNVYGYIRVSTETQADKGYGLETQQEAIINHCKSNNLNLVRVFSDEGLSGTLLPNQRPSLQELIHTCKENNIDSVVVYKLDRIARDLMVQLYIEEQLLIQDTTIMSVQEGDLSGNDPMTIAFRQMIGVFAELEKNTIVSRLTNGKATKAKGGNKPCGKAPFGYKWSHETNTIVIDPIETPIVKELFSVAYNRYGFQEIANEMNKRKKYNRNGKEWSRQSIRVILNNNFYAGILIHQGEEIDGHHEKLIDLETLKYIQGHRKPNQEDMDNLFRSVQI